MPDPVDEPHLLFERDGHVAVVTLNRPAKKNALSSEMLVRMYDAWLEIDQNPDIRVAVVTGAGGNFCSGADLKAMAAGHPDDEYSKRFAEDDDLHWKALLRHFIPGKPIIAAVEGYAVAGGTEILQAMDIRVAGASATFGVAEVRRGLFPLGGRPFACRARSPTRSRPSSCSPDGWCRPRRPCRSVSSATSCPTGRRSNGPSRSRPRSPGTVRWRSRPC